jgi:hypothetical protein
MGARRYVAAAAGAVCMLVGSACAAVLPAADVGEPPFAECKADTYAFVGEATLAALGLGEMWPEERGTRAEIWITAEAIDPQPIPGQVPMEPQRMICMELDDGSGMAGPIADDWQPPSIADDLATSVGSGPVVGGAIVIGLALLIGLVSFFAFRGGPDREQLVD